jgi:hypothetical protein
MTYGTFFVSSVRVLQYVLAPMPTTSVGCARTTDAADDEFLSGGAGGGNSYDTVVAVGPQRENMSILGGIEPAM